MNTGTTIDIRKAVSVLHGLMAEGGGCVGLNELSALLRTLAKPKRFGQGPEFTEGQRSAYDEAPRLLSTMLGTREPQAIFAKTATAATPKIKRFVYLERLNEDTLHLIAFGSASERRRFIKQDDSGELKSVSARYVYEHYSAAEIDREREKAK